MNLPKRNSKYDLNERDIMTRIRIINSFKLSEEAFLKKYYCDRDTLFNICLNSFRKLFREKTDIKFVSLYLYNLKKFLTLLKSINEENTNNTTQKYHKNQNDKSLKLLKYVSEHINYELFPAKRLVMRYGELGSKFYIILHGVVSILIPVRISLQMTFYEFSKYIANLLLYKEFELAKIAIRDNKHVYRVELPEMKYIINYFKKFTDESEDNYISKNNANLNIMSGLKSERNINASKIVQKMTRNIKDNTNDSNLSLEEDKIFQAEYAQKIEKFMKTCLSREQHELFEQTKMIKEEIEKDNGIEISSERYINRLKIYKKNIDDDENYLSNYKENMLKKTRSKRLQVRSKTTKLNQDKDNNNENDNLYLKANKNLVYIYEYQEIIQLETGDMFGDTALDSATSKRTATIISATDCHLGCLNKDLYNYIKSSNDKKRKNNINYIGKTKIFKSLKYKSLENKFINYFAFKNCVKDEYLMKIGEINNNIIIIKSGNFEINIKGNVNYIFEMVNEYNNNFMHSPEFNISDNLFKKIRKLNLNRKKIEKLLQPSNFKNVNENINDSIYKLFIINSSSFYGFKENDKKLKDNYVSFFEIKCISSEGEYILLDKKIFYRQIYSSDFKVKEETRSYIKEFTEKTINRLIHVLYSKIYFILSKNDLRYLKRIKILSGIKGKNKKEEDKVKSLMDEIKLDFDYMNRYDLSDIECIIDKILNKYNEEDFDNENIKMGLYNENEKDELINKNEIKLEEEKYNKNNLDIIFKQIRARNKINSIKLLNLRKSNKFRKRKSFNYSFARRSSNSEHIKKLINFYRTQKNSIFKDNIDSKIKNKSFSDEKKSNLIVENKIKNKRKFNFIVNNYKNNSNNNISYNLNNHDINKSSSLCVLGKPNDSFMSDININCNYVNLGNACISQIKFDFNKKKNNSLNSLNSLEPSNFNSGTNLKVDKLVGIGEKFNSRLERCFSAKHSSFCSINNLDSTQMSKNDYPKIRNKYVLKCVRNIWTRNTPIILYKRIKKLDKNI